MKEVIQNVNGLRDIESSRFILIGLLLLVPLLFGGCGGSDSYGGGGGETYDPPSSTDPVDTPPDPTLSSIQEKVFTPICTECHAGASAPQGLRLEDGMSYAMLVNVDSSEVPSLKRVEPGNPDDSYLIHKLEGTQTVGERMPLGGPYLADDTIAAIRQWITDGAPETAGSTASPATMKAAWPVADSEISADQSTLILASDSELDTTLVNDRTLQLFRISSGEREIVEGIELQVTSIAPTVIRLVPAGDLAPGRYELRVGGDGSYYLADRAGRKIDGDGDGIPGGDFRLRFSVSEER